VPENQKVSKYEALDKQEKLNGHGRSPPERSDRPARDRRPSPFRSDARRLVSHVRREHQVIFHCGGAALFRGALQASAHSEPDIMALITPAWQGSI